VHPVRLERVEREVFQPFGSMIAAESLDSPRFNRSPGNLGVLWVQEELFFPGSFYMCTLRYYYRGATCEFLQRHPASTVTLIPLGRRPSVIFVAPPGPGDSPPAPETVRAFLLDGDAGVVLHRNTWLRYAFPLSDYVDFAYITQRVDPATANSTDDVERYVLADEAGAVVKFQIDSPDDAELGPGGAVLARPQQQPPEH
jgi:ureidoglycolate hydrolase